jgi:hypothetical protein
MPPPAVGLLLLPVTGHLLSSLISILLSLADLIYSQQDRVSYFFCRYQELDPDFLIANPAVQICWHTVQTLPCIKGFHYTVANGAGFAVHGLAAATW